LVSRYFGGHVTEQSLKGLAKTLDDRGTRERQLKGRLKEILEQSGLAASSNEERVGHSNNGTGVTGTKEPEEEISPRLQDDTNGGTTNNSHGLFMASGDEFHLKNVIDSFLQDKSQSGLIDGISTAIGLRVRVKQVVDPLKDPVVANYNLGVVFGWKKHEETTCYEGGGDETETINYPIWRVILDKDGSGIHMNGEELLDSICRYKRWRNNEKDYFEDDIAILNYRNSLGRHCGKAADAGFSATPSYLARLMVKREQELYTSLKHLTYDNNWGGKSSARNIWITSMRDECYDYRTVKSGMFTLEDAFFKLTGGFPECMISSTCSAKDVLDDINERFDIELESIEKNTTLWNSRQSRDVFLYIMEKSSTTGFLALGLDLISRNCWAFANANKPRGRRAVSIIDTSSAPNTRSTRRMNAWQQANQDWY